MLLWISEQLVQLYSGFNVFQYITLRAILSILTALFLSLLIGPHLIRHLSERQIGQSIRHDGPQSHLSKAGTPTMGGALILVSIGVTTILWSNLSNRYIWVVLLVTALFGLVGWFDDYLKVIARNSKGLSAKAKYFWQSAITFCTIAFLLYSSHPNDVTTLVIPFFKYVVTISPWTFALLAYFVIVGTSNAVNLTDGLDGLAIMPTVLIAGALGIFVYAAGNFNFATYLGIPYISGAGEIIVFCGAIVGSGLGFLWFNTYPAQVFMGDVGALALGAALGIVAVIARQELVLFIMGGVFVVETISVILQVISFRLTGRRIFHMAPLHHHFELKGWPEPRVIVRFWIITVVLVLIGLATLKVR